MHTNTGHQVHIGRDGQLNIDNEQQIVPDGVDPSHVVIQGFHIEAAGSNLPVLVHVRDDRSNSQFAMHVMPDGTTQAPNTDLDNTQRLEPEHTGALLERIAAAQAAGRAHDFDYAITAADGILQQLTAEQGETGPGTLEAAQFRADLAYLSGDYAFATVSWTWLALAFLDRLGPGKRRTQRAAQNAAQAWMYLQPQQAVPLSTDLLNMLLEVTTPERTATMRSQIEERLRGLD
ncbi:hypothetical protein ACF1AB_35920 [Streptomyces sp. NPDC014846]|uniref:hypothetical protein n=1 Tax=Streptomyces sp. NPDC014846 TaxID=3364922 RepID=UPI0036FB4B6B